jgi:hypothetical protein
MAGDDNGRFTELIVKNTSLIVMFALGCFRLVPFTVAADADAGGATVAKGKER